MTGPQDRQLGLGRALEELETLLIERRRVDEVTNDVDELDDVDELPCYIKDQP
jgi:hypothetical protein